MKLEWLEVLEFRHVTPGARMEFADGVNVIMGRNGTGKTNLLKLLGALTRWDVSALEKERFHVRYGAKAGELRLEVELKNVPPRPRFRAGMMEGMVEETGEDWFAKVILRTLEGNEIFQEYSPYMARLILPGSKVYDRRAERGLQKAVVNAIFILVTEEESIVSTKGGIQLDGPPPISELVGARGRGRIDEGLEQFYLMNEGGAGDGTCPRGVFVHWLIDKYLGRLDTIGGDFPIDLLKWIRNVPPEDDLVEAEVADIIPALADAAQTLGLAKLRFLIRRTERKVDGEFTSDTMKGITFKAILPNGAEFDHDKLSFGQKRMLTFLWYAAANEHGPIIVDELANGLHHAWIQKCFEVIGDRQAFLSTQNPLILDFLDFTSAEHTARSMVRCEVGERGWRWGNLNAEEAERLYRACQANFMHVSEILRSEGLW